jgi:hypothetical protein
MCALGSATYYIVKPCPLRRFPLQISCCRGWSSELLNWSIASGFYLKMMSFDEWMCYNYYRRIEMNGAHILQTFFLLPPQKELLVNGSYLRWNLRSGVYGITCQDLDEVAKVSPYYLQ